MNLQHAQLRKSPMLTRLRSRLRRAWVLHFVLILALLFPPMSVRTLADEEEFTPTGTESLVTIDLAASEGTTGLEVGSSRQVSAHVEQATWEVWTGSITGTIQIRNYQTTPLVGESVSFSVISGDGGVSGGGGTDSSGNSSGTFTGGSLNSTVVAQAAGASGTIAFTDPVIPEVWTWDRDEGLLTASLAASGTTGEVPAGDGRQVQVHVEYSSWAVYRSNYNNEETRNYSVGPAVGAQVAWSVPTGDGAIGSDGYSSPTDGSGNAHVPFTMGTGDSIVRADVTYATSSSTYATLAFTAPAAEQWNYDHTDVTVSSITLTANGDLDNVAAGTERTVTATATGDSHDVFTSTWGNTRNENYCTGPISGLTISFSIASGDGTLAAGSAVTGGDGAASVNFTMGNAVSQLQAAAGGFAVTMSFNPASETWSYNRTEVDYSITLGADAAVDDLFPAATRQLTASVTGQWWDVYVSNLGHENYVNAGTGAASGVSVTFGVTTGDGQLSAATAATDSYGNATMGFTMGAADSIVQADVTSTSGVVNSATLTLTAHVPVWQQVGSETVISTNLSADGSNTTLNPGVQRTVTAQVMFTSWELWADDLGHSEIRNEASGAANGAALNFSVDIGDGSVTPVSATTDPNGCASATFTMGNQDARVRADASYATATSVGTLDFTSTPWVLDHSDSMVNVSLSADASLVGAEVTLTTWDVYTNGTDYENRNVSNSPAGGACVNFAAGGTAGSGTSIVYTDVAGHVSVPYSCSTGSSGVGTISATAYFLDRSGTTTIEVDSDGDGYSNSLEIAVGTNPYDSTSHPQPLQAGNFAAAITSGASVTVDTVSNGIAPYSFSGSPSYGSFSENGTYTAPSGYVGTDTFDATVTDASSASATFTVSVTVNYQPPALSAAPVNASSNNGTAANIQGSGSGGSGYYTYSLDGGPTNGTLMAESFASTGYATYTPNNGFVGTETFGYSVSDGYTSISGSIVIVVTRDSGQVIADDNSGTSNNGEAVVIIVGAHGGSGTYTFQHTGGPVNGGGVVQTGQNQFTYYTPFGEGGDNPIADSFSFRATDSNGVVSDNEGNVAITINRALGVYASSDAVNLSPGESQSLELTATGGVAPYSFSITSGPSGSVGTASMSGNVLTVSAAPDSPQGVTEPIGIHVVDTAGTAVDVVVKLAVRIFDVGIPTFKMFTRRECLCIDGKWSWFGMATYRFNPFVGSFQIADNPLSYEPAFGPPAGVSFHYDSADGSESGTGAVAYTNLGPRWKLNLVQFIKAADGDPSSAALNMGRGGEARMKQLVGEAAGKLGRPGLSKDWLERIDLTTWKHHLTDGSVEVYSVSGGTDANGQRYLFPSSISDPQGNTITFTWETQGGGMRLTSLTDATGKSTTFEYDDGANPLRLTKVKDPFGRFCTIEYNGNGEVWRLTDPVGIVSEFAYAAGGSTVISELTTPYGTTTFDTGELLDAGGQPNGRYALATDPVGRHERVERVNVTDPNEMPQGEPIPSWVDATRLNLHNTFLWTKQAYALGAGIRSNAQIIRWAEDATTGQALPIPASSKSPLVNRVWLRYPGQGSWGYAGDGAVPELTTQIQHNDIGNGDLEMNTWTMVNALGLPTSITDPQGRVTTYTYHGNDLDLWKVEHTASGQTDLLATVTGYVGGQPQTVTAADGTTTSIAYNGRGQPTSITNASGTALANTTSFTYVEDANSPAFGRRSTVTAAAGTGVAATTGFAYDGYGRLLSVTDPQGDTVTLAYDAVAANPLMTLDRVSSTTGPDGSGSYVIWDKLDVGEQHEFFPNAAERVTTYAHDATRKVTGVTYPSGKTISYIQGNCCSSVDTLVDAAGNQTHWEYDVLGRKTAKFLNWNNGAGTQVASYGYDAVGRIAALGDARGNVKNYLYNAEGQLGQIHYDVANGTTQPTPDVFLSYEPVYGRLATVLDGTGTTGYSYVPINAGDGVFGDGGMASETKIVGGAVQYTHSYGYDALGRTVSGPRQNSAQWDALGRLTNLGNGLGAFSFAYDGISGRLSRVDTALTGATVALRASFTYEGANSQRRLTGILHQKDGGTGDWSTFSQHAYTYDAQGRLATWQQWAAGAQRTWTLTNDTDDQLTGVQETDGGGALGAFGYGYDAAGNRVSATRSVTATNDSVTREWSANALNQLTTQTAGPESGTQFTYDADGNTLGDGACTYEWDAENRLVGVNYGDGLSQRVEWSYDAFDRRVQQRDNDGSSTVTRDLIWEGLSIIESRNQSSGEVRKYYGNGEERAIPGNDVLRLYYTTDHLGSVREVVDSGGAVRVLYEYSPEGKRTKVGNGDLDCNFGFTGHYTHEASDLILAPYRAYNTATVRWLSHDPIEESGGINLYAYVRNRFASAIDRLGFADLDFGGGYSGRVDDWNRGSQTDFQIHIKKNGKEIAVVTSGGGYQLDHGGKPLKTPASEIPKEVRKQIRCEITKQRKRRGMPVTGILGAGILINFLRGEADGSNDELVNEIISDLDSYCEAKNEGDGDKAFQAASFAAEKIARYFSDLLAGDIALGQLLK